MKKRSRRLMSLLLALLLLLSLAPEALGAYGTGYVPEKGTGEIYAQGVDLSTWQGHEVDFNKIKAQGFSFVILRAGFARTMDDTFEENYARARKAGLDVGVYLYSYARDEKEALQEAEACRKWLKGKLLEYPVYYDLEEPEIHGSMSPEKLTDIALAFLDSMARDGWLSGLYSCKSWFDSRYELERITGTYECWIAQYFSSGTSDAYERYTEDFGMWQYSASGQVSGVEGSVDLNVAFRDYPSICRQFGFNGYPAGGETLWLRDPPDETVLAQGTQLKLEGRILSGKGNIETVRAWLYDDQGAPRAGTNLHPHKKSLELSELLPDLDTTQLHAGRYFLSITAENQEQTARLLEQSLVISPAGIRLDGFLPREDLREGDSLHLTGTLTASTEILHVTAGLYDLYGNPRFTGQAKPEALTYDLRQLSEQIDCSGLRLGSYLFRITAATTLGTETLVSYPVSVWVRRDPITLRDLKLEKAYLPGELKELSGRVTSSVSCLRQVQVTLGNYEGRTLAEARSDLRKTTAELQELSQSLGLQELQPGTYTLFITAINDAGPQNLLNTTFRIDPDALSLCGPQVPVVMTEGDSFLLSGLIASDRTELTEVSVTVRDEREVTRLRASVLPEHRRTLDLYPLNEELLFSTLEAGTYQLRIHGENATGARILYDAPLQVVPHTDRISWEKNDFFRPMGTAYGPGRTPWIWGTLISEKSDLKSLKVEIITPDGQRVTGVETSLRGKRTALTPLNEQLKLSALGAGNYIYRLTAANGSGTYVLLEDRFSVTDCPHAHVGKATVYEPDCSGPGAQCDTYCRDCGRKVYSGTALEQTPHTYSTGHCARCGKEEPRMAAYRGTVLQPRPGTRAVLAVRAGKDWYALDPQGQPRKIKAPREGTIWVPGDLVWTVTPKKWDGCTGLALTDGAGRALHLDSAGPCLAWGSRNAIFHLTRRDSAFVLTPEGGKKALTLKGMQQFYLFIPDRLPCPQEVDP